MADPENIRFVVETVVTVLVLPLAAVLWYLLKGAREDLARLDARLADLKLHVSETYSTKTDLNTALNTFTRAVDLVFAKLDRIDDKLDGKADKVRA